MAANDYYYGYDNSHNDAFYRSRREDAPLPSLPATGLPSKPRPQEQPSHDISPVESPFEDTSYPAYSRHDNYNHTPYDPTAPAASSSYSYNDPFADKNAIPLQAQKPGMNPMGVELENGGIPRKLGSPRDRPPDGRRGWFTRPITWAVFFLSIVQLIVLIVEFIRNGMQKTVNPLALSLANLSQLP